MREIFKKQRKMTFVWQADYQNHGPDKPLLTHVFPKNYAWPNEFRYEEKYNEDNPLITDKNSLDYNLDIKCDALLNHSQEVVDYSESKHNMMILFGDDFAFQNAYYNFWVLDEVLGFCNQRYGKPYNIEFI